MNLTGKCSILLCAAVAALLVSSAGATAAEPPPSGRSIDVSPTGVPDGDGSAAKPLDIATAFSTNSPAKPGDTIRLGPGRYDGPMKAIARLPFVLAVSGTADQPIRIMPAPGGVVHLNGTLTIRGSNDWVIGLEIGDLLWDATQKTHQNSAAVAILAPSSGTKLINCNLFGGGDGIVNLSHDKTPGTHAEYYGCLVHDDGSWAHNRRSGTAFYLQNAGGLHVISHCASWRTADRNFGAHGQHGPVIGFEITQNIFFLAGAQSLSNDYENLFINTSESIDRASVVSNVLYQPEMAISRIANIRMSNYKAPALNQSAVFRDNYVIGAPTGLRLGDWQHLQVRGNTFWAGRVLVEINSATIGDGIPTQPKKPDLAGYAFDANTYYAPADAKNFLYANSEKDIPATDYLTFAEWQKLGLDRDSQVLPVQKGKPTGTKAFVFPNQYEAGRATVAIFNWDGHPDVAVDLAPAIPKGAKFAAYNLLDIRQTIGQAKPVLTGTFDGGTVKFPMRKDPISPDFDAFLVVPAP